MSLRPYSSNVLALCALVLIGMGLYFVLLRPALLAEDVRYIGTSLPKARAAMPGLFYRLDKEFWVMGGYIITAGLLTLYVAITSFQSRARVVSGAVALVRETAVAFPRRTVLEAGSGARVRPPAFATSQGGRTVNPAKATLHLLEV